MSVLLQGVTNVCMPSVCGREDEEGEEEFFNHYTSRVPRKCWSGRDLIRYVIKAYSGRLHWPV